MARFGFQKLCLLLLAVALSSAQYPTSPYGSSQYPSSPYGSDQYVASPYGLTQYPSSQYSASSTQYPTPQYGASPYGPSTQYSAPSYGSTPYLTPQYGASPYGSSQYPPSYGSSPVLPPYFGLSGYGQQASYGFPYGGNPMMYPQSGSIWPPVQLGFGGMSGDFDDPSALSPFGFGSQSSVSGPSFFGQLNQLQDSNNNGIADQLEMTKSKIDDYLAKTQQLGNRKLSVQVDYLNTPLEYQFLSQYHGIQHPLSGTSLGDYFNVPKPQTQPSAYQSQSSQYQSQPSTYQSQSSQYQSQPSMYQSQSSQYQSQPSAYQSQPSAYQSQSSQYQSQPSVYQPQQSQAQYRSQPGPVTNSTAPY